MLPIEQIYNNLILQLESCGQNNQISCPLTIVLYLKLIIRGGNISMYTQTYSHNSIICNNDTSEYSEYSILSLAVQDINHSVQRH